MESKDSLQKEFGVSIPPSDFCGFLPYKETVSVYHQSQIMLGVQNAQDQVTQRTFEILGTGALMIASRTEEMERLFQHGEEVLLSSCGDETLELVEYYSKRPEERLRIGRKARAKVMTKHTFAHRLNQVWSSVIECIKL